MGIIIKQSIKNAFISYLGIIIGFYSTIKLYPTILDTDQFGLTRVLIAIMTLSTQVVNIGFPVSIIKFFPRFEKKMKHPNGLIWAFMIPPVLGIITFSILVLIFDDLLIGLYEKDSSLFGEYYYFLIPMVIFSSSFVILNAFVKAHLNTVFASFIQDILHRIIVIANLLLFSFSLISFDEFILIFVSNYALNYLLLLIYAFYKKMISLRISLDIFKPEIRAEFFSYSYYVFFAGFTMILVGNIDLIMVGTFEGLSKSGIYAIALYVGSVISVPKKAIGKISLPIIAKSFEENNFDNIKRVYSQTSLNQFAIGFLIYIGVIANIDNLYALLPADYVEGSVVIYIIGFAHLFNMVTGANGQIIISSKYFRFDLYSSIFLMSISVVLNLILIPRYGLVGASIATASSMVIYNLAKLIFLYVKMRIQPFKPALIGISITGLFALLLSSFVEVLPNTYLDILLRSICIAIWYFLCIRIFKLSDEVNDTITSIYRRFLTR